jgi:tetratricopeptide (TPR) repeat protein
MSSMSRIAVTFSLVRFLALAAVLTFVQGCSRGTSRQGYLESGNRYMATGQFAEAIIQYRNAVQKDPRAGDAHAKLAEAFIGTGDLANGLKEYVRAADLLPDDLALQVKTGNLLLLAGRFDDAKARADKVLAKNASDVTAQLLKANSLAGLKDLEAAVTQIEDALRVAPDRSETYANLGALELGRGKRDAAEQAFKRAVELQPNSISANLALGTFYWLTGRLDTAEASLKRALELDPRNALTNRVVANFDLATNRLESAEGPLKTVFEVTKTPDAAVALEEYYVATGKDTEARGVLQPMLGDSRTAPMANVRLAALDYKSGQHDEAYKRLAAVLEKDPANLQALLVKSSILISDGKPDEALASANVAVERHADSAAAFFTLGKIQTIRRQPDAAIAAYQEVLHLNPRATEAKIALGQVQLGQGQTDAALGLANEALANEPANGGAQLLYVRGLLAQGSLDRAETELKRLALRFPTSATVHTQMGMLSARRGRIPSARAEFERALTLQPDEIEALGGLVALDLSARNYTAARARVDARLASSQTPPLLLLAARTYAAGNDMPAAEKFLLQATTLDSNYVAAYGALAQLYVFQGKLDAARSQFQALVERSPKSVAGRTMVGVILEAKGDIDGARDQFERVLQIDPEAAVAANNLAWIYAQHGGNLDVAMQLAQTAQKRLPGVAEVGDTLGFIYYKKDLTALAISTLKTSVAKDPNNAIYHYHLGLAYASSGDAAQARGSMARALALKSDFDGSEQARKLLSGETLR